MNFTNPAFSQNNKSESKSVSKIDPNREKKKIFGLNQENQSLDEQQTNNLLEIYEQEIDELKSEVNRHRNNDKLSQQKSDYSLSGSKVDKKDLEKYQLAVVHLNNELEKAKKQVFDLQVELERKQQIEQQLQKALQQLNKARQVIDEKNNDLFNQQRNNPPNKNLEQLQDELNSYKLFIAENNPAKLNDIVKEQANEIEQLKFERDNKSKEFNKLLTDYNTINQKFNGMQSELFQLRQLNNDNGECRRQLQSSQEQVSLQAKQLNQCMKENAELKQFKDQYYTLSQQNDQMRPIIETQKKRIQKQEEEIQLFNDHLLKYKEEIQSLTGQLINGQKFNEKTKQYQKLLQELESQNQNLLNENKDYEILLDKFQKETTYLNQKQQTVEMVNQDLQNENDELKRALERFKTEIQFLNEKLMQSQQGLMEGSKQEQYIQQLQNEILYFNQQVAQLKQDVDSKQHENNRLQAMISHINSDLNNKQLSSSITYRNQDFEISELQGELQQLSSKLAEFEKIKEMNERKFEELNMHNQNLMEQNGQLKSQLGTNQDQLAQSAMKFKQLESMNLNNELKNKQQTLINLQQQLTNAQQQLAQTTQEKDNLQKILEQKEQELKMFYDETGKTEIQSKSLIQQLKQELDKQKIQSQNSQEQATQLYYKLTDQTTQNSNLQQEIQKLKQQQQVNIQSAVQTPQLLQQNQVLANENNRLKQEVKSWQNNFYASQQQYQTDLQKLQDQCDEEKNKLLEQKENLIKQQANTQASFNQVAQLQAVIQKKNEEIERINELLNIKKIEAQNATTQVIYNNNVNNLQCNEMRRLQAQLAMSPQRA